MVRFAVHDRRLVVLCGAAALLMAGPAAGAVFTDSPAVHLLSARPDLSGVGFLSTADGASAVLIDSRHILTAKHAVASIEGGTFTLYGDDVADTFHLVSKRDHPTADLSVVELDRDTGLPGYALAGTGSLQGKTVLVAGFGVSGTGAPDAEAFPRGTGRYGYNRITFDLGSRLLSVFDAPGSTGCVAGEAMMALGDSGGPTFTIVGDQLFLAGIHVGVTDSDGDGAYPEYGDFGSDIRVSAYASWIGTAVPEPGSLILLVVGAAATLLPGRRHHAAYRRGASRRAGALR